MYHDLVNNMKPGRRTYSKELVLVCRFEKELADRIGDNEVYISEFVLAKILGYLPHLVGHPEISKNFLLILPEYLQQANEILMRLDRPKERYLICGIPNHRVVLEIKRDGGKTQINTIHLIKEFNLKKLENKCIFL